MANKGYYSLIQYCPDRSRLEGANVGVVLFCPEQRFLQARLSSGTDRLRRFFGTGSFDPSALAAAKRALAARLHTDGLAFQTIEDMEHFIATRANALTLTPARPLKVDDPAGLLDSLFTEVLSPRLRGPFSSAGTGDHSGARIRTTRREQEGAAFAARTSRQLRQDLVTAMSSNSHRGENELLARITTNAAIFSGKPIIRGHRLAVEHVLGMLAAGDTQ